MPLPANYIYGRGRTMSQKFKNKIDMLEKESKRSKSYDANAESTTGGMDVMCKYCLTIAELCASNIILLHAMKV